MELFQVCMLVVKKLILRSPQASLSLVGITNRIKNCVQCV